MDAPYFYELIRKRRSIDFNPKDNNKHEDAERN